MKKLNSAGGLIKGGSKDRIPVMMSPGVFRVSKAAIDKYGREFFRKLNGGDTTQIICIDEKEENGDTQSK